MSKPPSKEPAGASARQETLRRIEQTRKNGSWTLNLPDLGLRELPDEIGQLSQLQALDLSRNRLRTLPDAIGQLSCLEILHLIGTPI